MKRIRAAAVALVVIAAAVYLILDMDVEKADYGDSLQKTIAEAEELYQAQKDNSGNEEGQYAPYTLLAFQSQIDEAKAVADNQESEYNAEKDAYEALKDNIKAFKKAENTDVVSEEKAKELAGSGETENYTVDFKEDSELKYTISGSDLKSPVTMNLMAREKGPYYEDIAETLSQLSLSGQIVSFYQDGSFGGKLQVEAPMYSEKKVKSYAYKVDLQEGTLQYVSDGSIDVDKQTVTFSVSEGGDYVVLTKKMHESKDDKVVDIEEEEQKVEAAKKAGKTGGSGGSSSGNASGGSGGTQSSAEPAAKNIDVTIEIRCDTLASDLSKLENPALESYIPADGTILPTTKVTVEEGTTVFDVLNKVCRDKGIQVESSYTPAYGSYYVEGINHLYEFDGGKLSGWMYKVNGWFPNYGCSAYTLKDGDVIVWVYTCDLGNDVGGGMS